MRIQNFITALVKIVAVGAFVTNGLAIDPQTTTIQNMDDLPQRLDSFLTRPHPRLLIPAEGIVPGSVTEQRARALIPVADATLDAPALEHKLDLSKRRILYISRAALTRITSLALAWRLTGERKYFDCAESNLLTVCAFPDWNPNHYLDTAEMMLAVSFGLDWLYNDLSPESRKKIEDALYEKGLATATPDKPCHHMITLKNNWGQVCNGGITAAALALAEQHREESLACLQRAFVNFRPTLASYEPDGIYPEGPMYWNYGTQYTMIFLMLVERSLGTSYGIADHKALSDSLDFMIHATGSSGLLFNFADCWRKMSTAEGFAWFAQRYGKKLPAALPCIRELRDTPEKLTSIWLYPAVTVFALDENKTISESTDSLPLDWHGRGKTEILTMRSDWTPQAWFVGIKAGTVSVPHAHMDIGSFVLDAFGDRWAEDPDMETYALIESKGIKIWNGGQEEDRWKIFRCGIEGHNIPCINGARQLVTGHASIAASGLGGKSPSAILDLKEIYGFPISRQFQFPNRSGLTITDTLRQFPVGSKYRWQMLTQAEVRIVEPSLLQLSQNGKTIYIKNNLDLPWQVVEVEKLLADWDSPLTGLRRISIETTLPATNQEDFSLSIEITADKK